MDLERKIELLKASYLSGYAAIIAGIDLGIILFEEGLSREKGEQIIERLYHSLGIITIHYDNKVPFLEITQEMSAADWDDFAILFRVREILPKVKAALDRYTDFLRSDNYHAQKDISELRILWQAWAERFDAEQYQGMNLKDRILKYDPTFKSQTGSRSDWLEAIRQT